MDEPQEVSGGFFVAGGDSTKMFDAVDKAFDLVAAAVLSAQQASRDGASGPRRDHGGAAAVADLLDELVAVVPFVRDQVARFVIRQQPHRLSHIVRLSGRHGQFDRTPLGLNGQVQLGAESATRPTEGLVLAPFFLAPAACWWARMTVESSIRHSRSGSCQACKRRPHTPRLDQRLNRWKTEFHAPNRSGRSRHGAPVRAIHKTALMKPRLSSAVCPGSPGLPGTQSLILFHCSSETSCRRIAVFLREPPQRSIRGPCYARKIGEDIGIGKMNVNRT